MFELEVESLLQVLIMKGKHLPFERSGSSLFEHETGVRLSVPE